MEEKSFSCEIRARAWPLAFFREKKDFHSLIVSMLPEMTPRKPTNVIRFFPLATIETISHHHGELNKAVIFLPLRSSSSAFKLGRPCCCCLNN
jgi:hypothetical protein